MKRWDLHARWKLLIPGRNNNSETADWPLRSLKWRGLKIVIILTRMLGSIVSCLAALSNLSLFLCSDNDSGAAMKKHTWGQFRDTTQWMLCFQKKGGGPPVRGVPKIEILKIVWNNAKCFWVLWWSFGLPKSVPTLAAILSHLIEREASRGLDIAALCLSRSTSTMQCFRTVKLLSASFVLDKTAEKLLKANDFNQFFVTL